MLLFDTSTPRRYEIAEKGNPSRPVGFGVFGVILGDKSFPTRTRPSGSVGVTEGLSLADRTAIRFSRGSATVGESVSLL